MIKKYFKPEEITNRLTAKYFSKLYYEAEIWHIPGLTLALEKNLKFASGKFLGTVIMKKAVILNEQSL